jgi:hypothetical protein
MEFLLQGTLFGGENGVDAVSHPDPGDRQFDFGLSLPGGNGPDRGLIESRGLLGRPQLPATLPQFFHEGVVVLVLGSKDIVNLLLLGPTQP